MFIDRGESGTLDLRTEPCRAYGIAEPIFTEASGAVTITFKAEVVADLGCASSQVQMLEIASVERSLPELMTPTVVKNRMRFRTQVVALLLDAGLFERTISDKPRSSRQQYRTTEAGREILATTRKT